MNSSLDAFMPAFDARERFAVRVRAPAPFVYDIARQFDMQSLRSTRAIFWLRGKLMRSASVVRKPQGFIDETRALGWGTLLERPGQLFVAGARCQPWLAAVVFTPIAPEGFQRFAEPGQVKIAWTLETHARDGADTELASETRVCATDDYARRRFLCYWRWARVGIFSLRWLLLPAIRTRAEAAYWRSIASGTA